MSAGAVQVWFFCLGTGAAMGCLFLLFQVLIILLSAGKWLTFAADVIFCCICAAVVFMCALAVDHGRLRFIQAGAQLLGGWAVVTLLGPVAVGIAKLLSRWKGRTLGVFRKFVARAAVRFCPKKSKRLVKAKKSKEKAKKPQKKT